MYNRKTIQHYTHTQGPQATQYQSDVDIMEERIQFMQVVPRLTMPTKSIDQWSTWIELPAIYPPSLYTVDSLAIDQQTTVTIPAIRKANGSSITEVKSSSENHVELIRKLAKSSGVYAIASFVSPLIALVLAPFLTHNLSHNDYGALTILNTAISLIVGITQFGLASAFFRAYNCDYESERDHRDILGTVVILLSLSTIPVAIGVFVAASLVSSVLFGTAIYSGPVKIAAVIVLVQNLTVPGFSWCRAEGKPGFFSSLSIVNLFVSLGANIFLVGVLHMSITGSLLATAAGYTCVVLLTLPLLLLRAGLRLRIDITQNLISFGLPLVFNFVSIWVLQLSDRYLLGRLGTLAEVASYGVAYTLGGVLSVLIITPFMLAWPSAMFTIAKRKDAVQAFQLVFRWFSALLLLAAYGLSLLSTALLNLLFPPAYHSAASVIPIVAMSTMFYGLSTVCNVGTSIQRKNWYQFLFAAIAALVNIIANLALIPLYGSMGAAVSTLIAYVILVLLSYLVNQRLYPVPFEVGKFVFALAIGIALYGGSEILAQPHGIIAAWGILLSAFFLYGSYLLLSTKFFPMKNKTIETRIQEVLIS
jgi:O-antigen/teichoic acid export membrane protein